MNWGNRSVRFRLTLWYSVVLLIGQLISGLMIWFLFSHSLHGDLDASLVKRAKGLERYLVLEASENQNNLAKEMEEFARSLPADYLMQVKGPDGRVLATSGIKERDPTTSLPPTLGQGGLRNFTLSGTRYRWFGEVMEDGAAQYSVALAAPLHATDETLNHLAFLLIAVSPAVVLIAAFGGFWISRRALAPVGEMTAAASSIDFDNLSARLDVPQTSDEVQRLAETWNAMLQRIENSAVQITRFTADASHELRTPLSLIRATTEFALRRPRTPEHYREALEVIGIEGERMTRLVEDLLFLARADATGHRHEELFDFRVPIRAAVSELTPKADAKNVRFRIESLDSTVLVAGDEDAIRRLVLVLLDNAVKYSPVTGNVTVGLNVSDRYAVLTVHDAGRGIPPEAKEHIFERFYRADPSRQAESPSYGLGLAISRAVAVQHGIGINFESEPGSTTFSVHFPLSEIN